MEMVSSNKIEDKELLELFNQQFQIWNGALKTGNPEEVVKLYSIDSTLLPTLSPDFKIGREEVKGYFEHDFLPKNPTGEVVKVDVASLGENYFSADGFYDFEVGPENSRHTVNARFTFIFKKGENGTWEIFRHHSSLRPNPAPSNN